MSKPKINITEFTEHIDNVLNLLHGIFHTAASTNVISVTDAYTAPHLYHNQSISSTPAKATYTVKLIAPQVTDDDGSNAVDNSIHLIYQYFI